MKLERPNTPKYLRQATFEMFGRKCLLCEWKRQLKVAHIHDWPTCRERAGLSVNVRPAPPGWHFDAAKDMFHNLGNVVPLCPTHHDWLDDKSDLELTGDDVRRVRDDVVRRPETLRCLIDFVCTELWGRPSGVGGQHAFKTDMYGCTAPQIWIRNAYRVGILTEGPHLIVESRTPVGITMFTWTRR